MSSGSKKIVAEVEVKEEALMDKIKLDIEKEKSQISENDDMRDEKSAVYATVRRIDHIIENLTNQLQQKHPQVQSVTIEVGIYNH